MRRYVEGKVVAMQAESRTVEKVASDESERREGLPSVAHAEHVLHVVPNRPGWGIRVGSGDVERIFRSKEDAFWNARAWAIRADRWVVVHGNDPPLDLRVPDERVR